jgi:hypothetical protein
MITTLRPAAEVRKIIEENKIEAKKDAEEYVTSIIPEIRKQIDARTRLMEYNCSVRLSNVNLVNSFVQSAYSDALTKLLQPLGYQFSLNSCDNGIYYLNVFWNESIDKILKRI